MNDKKNGQQPKAFVRSNIVWLLGVAFAVINLYITSLILPLKQDIIVLASRINIVELNQKNIEAIQIQTELNAQKTEIMGENIKEIKQSLVRIEDRLNSR